MTTEFARLSSALAARYAFERELGAGGMATVYLAEDRKLRRNVAVKVLRPELASALGPERFLREIEIAAKLHHPHVLSLHDSGEVESFLYYVMPFVQGESLADRLAREGELPIGDAIRVLREVADALAYAHQQGVVHRDIKPDNVMLADGHALVTDFGVAKAVSEAAGKEQLTTAGMAIGTPAYMAPEQAAGDPTIDHRVDIYAIGVLGYQILTGRAPFGGTTPQQQLAAHITDTPDPVSRLRPSVPDDLASIVMRCLEKRPSDRWQRAEDITARLADVSVEGVAAPPPVRAAPVRPVIRPRTTGPARRWIATAVLVVAAFVVGALIFRTDGRLETRTFAVQHLDSSVVYQALGPYIDESSSMAMIGGMLSVRATSDNLDGIAALLPTIDVPQPGVGVRVMLVIGRTAGTTSPRLEEVAPALDASMPFPAYHLFTQALMTGRVAANQQQVVGDGSTMLRLLTTVQEIAREGPAPSGRFSIAVEDFATNAVIYAGEVTIELGRWQVLGTVIVGNPQSPEDLILVARIDVL